MRNKGTLWVLLSAVFFSLAGILIKSIQWSSFSISGARSLLSIFVILIFMKSRGHHFVLNRAVVLGAACNFIMSLTFVIATKTTSAANAIVLQFTEPIFMIIAMLLIFGRKPNKDAVITCIAVVIGIVCFFFGKLTAAGIYGNILAIISGISYTGVFLIKTIPDSNFESSILLSHFVTVLIGVPFIVRETDFSTLTVFNILLLGLVQYGLSYVFLSMGLDKVSPVTASLTSTIEPILNPIIVALFGSEKIGLPQVIGSILVVGASAIYNIKDSLIKPGNAEIGYSEIKTAGK